MIAGLPTHKASEKSAATRKRGAAAVTVVIEAVPGGIRVLRAEEGRK